MDFSFAGLHSYVPYHPEFVAKVALDAQANLEYPERVAHRYRLATSQVVAWRRRLESTASLLVSGPAPDAPGDKGLSPAPYRLALEQIGVSVAILETDELRYRYANPAYQNIVPGIELVGRRFCDIFPVSTSDGVAAGLQQVLATGETWIVNNFQASLPEQGMTIWEGEVARLPAEEGRAPAIVIWIRDTTAAATVEMSLREQVALLQAISENSTDVMFAKDRHGRLQFANPATLALIGKPLDEVVGKTDAELLQDKHAALRVMENDRRIMNTGAAEEVEEEVPLPDGSHRTWLSEKRPYFDASGQVIGLLGVSRDITYRKQSEVSARTAHDTLQRVLDSITDGLATLDRQWRYTYFSETGARILGLRSEDLLGKCVWDLFPYAEQSTFGQEYRRAVETGVATHFEEFYPEPLNKWIECHCYPSPEGLSVYFRDVSDRRRAQEAALENERRIAALLDASPVGLAYADSNGRILVMNGEARRIWGDPPAAESVDEYARYTGWWADQSERHGRPIAGDEWPTARALRGEYVSDTPIEVEPFDLPRTRRLILHRSVPIKDENGAVAGAVTAMMDVTEFTETKRAVVEGNHRIQQLVNTIPQLAWMADRDGGVNWFNKRWLDYTGADEAQMKGWGWQPILDEDELPIVLERWETSIKNGTPFEMTFSIKGRDGKYRPFYTLAEPLKDLEDNVVQWFGTCTDVSTLQSVQENLTKTQHWLQEGLVAAHMVAWEWDVESDEIRYSDNVREVLGYGPGKSSLVCRSVHPEDLSIFEAAIKEAIAACASLDHVSRRIRPDNHALIWIRVKGHVLLDQRGAVIGMRGILIDVTEQVLREQALEDASKRKDEFLAMLAHELRNPLAPIATAAQMLTLGSGADAQRSKTFSEIITRQLGHMTRLIDDLLDVSRVTRGLVELEIEPLAMTDIVNSAIEQTRPLIEARKHELTLQFDARPALVMGDRVRLCQVLANLLNNSAKYTPQGGKIALKVVAEEQNVTIAVSDNGIGIDEHLLPQVFDLFTQATRTPDRAQGGLGLGLALVDNLVRMHGGRVSAQSEGIGSGARFIVTLPRIQEVIGEGSRDDIHFADTAARSEGKLSIMVVDDNIDAADMLAEMLRVQGHATHVEYTSTATLAAAGHQPFDLYVLDIGLPDLDGYELVRRLRAMPHNAGAVFVALTGYGQAHDKVLSKSAGFDHHLVKPIDFPYLQSIIRHITKP